MHWPEDKKCCAHGILFLIDNSHDQLLIELKIKIKIDKYSYFASELQRDVR